LDYFHIYIYIYIYSYGELLSDNSARYDCWHTAGRPERLCAHTHTHIHAHIYIYIYPSTASYCQIFLRATAAGSLVVEDSCDATTVEASKRTQGGDSLIVRLARAARTLVTDDGCGATTVEVSKRTKGGDALILVCSGAWRPVVLAEAAASGGSDDATRVELLKGTQVHVEMIRAELAVGLTAMTPRGRDSDSGIDISCTRVWAAWLSCSADPCSVLAALKDESGVQVSSHALFRAVLICGVLCALLFEKLCSGSGSIFFENSCSGSTGSGTQYMAASALLVCALCGLDFFCHSAVDSIILLCICMYVCMSRIYVYLCMCVVHHV
jgi:hypothetical protein